MRRSGTYKRIYPVILIIFFVTAFFSCKDKNALPDNYLMAEVDGKQWNANLSNNNETVLAVLSQGVVAIGAQQKSGDKTSTLLVTFPKNVALHTEITLDFTRSSTVSYSSNGTDGYTTDPSRGGSGILIVTRMDESAGIVEGTFRGEAVNSSDGSKISIKDGRFRSVNLQGGSQISTPGKK